MKQTIEDLLSSNNDSQLSNSDKLSIKEVILESLTDDTVNIYFGILSRYLSAKRQKRMSTNDVAEKSGFPPTTIKRFENLQTIPKTLTLLKILKSVGLKLSIEDF